jgi:hypothetical protein
LFFDNWEVWIILVATSSFQIMKIIWSANTRTIIPNA